ncbi:MAG TPA: PAS domain S-box protein [Pyrinomonadaceae bacterium]|nr:PAS domain S-box protein [Pyrinomonadaceae bacterium]
MIRVIRTSSLRALAREAKISEERRRDLEEAYRELEALRRRVGDGDAPQTTPAAVAPDGRQAARREEGDGMWRGDGQLAARQAARPGGGARVARLALAPLVLVVEDDPEINRFVAEALSQTCRVVLAADGAEGVERARELRPDLVISDVMTPGMSGERLVSELRRSDDLRDVPVLMLTAMADDELRVRLLRAGAQDFLTKPFAPAELLARAENLIQLKRTREMLQEELESQSGDLTALAREVAARRREMQSALEALGRSNRTLQAIIEASPLAIVTLDEAAVVRSWNPAAERTFGWTEEEIVGRPLPTVPEELQEEVARNHAAAVAGSSFTNFETRRRRKDGTVIDVSISTAPLLDAEGRPQGVVALVADITERKRAEEELRRREKELTDFTENATVGLHWVGPDGKILWANRSELELLGYTREEYVGRHISEFHADPEAIKDILARLARGEELYGYEARLRAKDGSVRHVLINSNVYWEGDRFVHTRCFTRDITERKQAEDAIRFQAHLLDTVEEAVIATDLGGHVTYWNRFAERMYGWRAGEVIGRNVVEVTPAETTREQADEIMSRLREGQSWSGEFFVRRRDGTSFPVSVTDTPIYDSDGRQVGIVGVSRDITRRKRAEDERARLAAQIEGERRRLKELVGNVPGVVWEAWGEPDAQSQRINFVSDYVETLLGYTVEEWLQTPNFWLTIVHPEDRERAAAEARRKFDSRKGGASQFRWVRKDGRAIHVEAQSLIICDDGGNPVGMRGVTMDITERKRAEAALRESEERFRTLADSVPVLIWLNGLVGCEFVNRQYLDFLGRTMEEVLAMDWAMALHPEDAEAYVAAYRDAFERRAPFSARFRFRRADGEYRWLRSDGLPRFTPDGTFLGYVGSSFDVTDMKLAEEAARASERRFRELVDQSPFSTQLFSPDGRTVRVNPAWERLWGVALSDLDAIGYNILEDRQLEEQGILQLIRRAFAGEATPLPPVPYDPPTGEFAGFPRWVQAFIYPVKDERGEVREVVLMHEDVSVRMRAEEALRESQARLEGIVESAMDAIITVDEEQQVVLFNHAAERMFGLRALEAVGRPLEEFMPRRFRGEHREHVHAFGRTGVTTRAMAGARAVAGLRADGTEFPLEASISQIETNGRKLYTVIMRDITERQRAEEERRFLADATTALASSLDYAATLAVVARLAANFLADYCLVDLVEDDGRVRRLTAEHRDPARADAWREMQKRHPVAPDSDHTVARVLREGRPELFSEVDGAALARITPHAPHAEELRRLGLRSAMTVPLVARGRTLGALTFISAESGRPYGDRELRLAEELARRAGLAVDNARLYQRAQEANRAKDEFLATLSHELRTPLTPIIGWVHLMRGGAIRQEELTHGLSVIDKNSQSLSRLINDLLDMSAILNDKMRIDRAPVPLESVIRQAADTVRPQAEGRGVVIELDSSCADPPPEVSGDRTRLAQVFWNLLTNAVKFSPEGGRVRVRCERDGRVARVHVEDEGVGIPAEFLPHVFDRFQQADMSTTKQYGGLGIGLALVRSFVEAHGGTVTAASEGEGRGSRFTVSLPLTELRNADFGVRIEEQPRPATAPSVGPVQAETRHSEGAQTPHSEPVSSSPQSAIRIPQSKGRVLVVEDAPDTLEMLRVFLTARGYEVAACATAAEALRVAGRGHFDIIVSDIGLPDTDGYELLARIRRELPHMASAPALAVTGYAAERDAELARAAGFAAHLAKPFEPAELADSIERLLAAEPDGEAAN